MPIVAPRWTPDRVNLVARMWSEGASSAQIAAVIGGGCTRNAVIGLINRKRLLRKAPVPALAKRAKPAGLASAVVSAEAHDAPATKATPLRPITYGPVTLLELRERHCRWPLGGPNDRAVLFCGCRSVIGKPYCAEHLARAFSKGNSERAVGSQDRSAAPGGRRVSAQLKAREAHVWARDEHDWYVEPSWVWERLFERKGFTPGMTVLDPACGMGVCVQAARRAGLHGLGTDIVARWRDIEDLRDDCRCVVSDFLLPDFREGGWPVRQTPGWQFPDAICSNPPFKHAQAFAEFALKRAVSSVCLLLPSKWVQGDRRARWLATTPLHRILYLCPRPSMPPGSAIMAGQKPGNGTTDFAIFWWLRGYDGEPQVGWLHRDGVVE